jgi:hypothetical protein
MENDNQKKLKRLVCPVCITAPSKKKLSKLEKWNSQLVHLRILAAAHNLYADWACDNCFKEKLAIEGNPLIQNYGIGLPFLAYYDKEKKCNTCGEHFIFRKEEQQFWYEELQFIIWSEPKNCSKCRKEKRAPYEINTEISNLVRDINTNNLGQLEKVIELYLQINKVEKAKYYFSFVKKLVKGTNDNSLVERVRLVKEKIDQI